MRGQRAVADVVLNRTKQARFASTPCGVIHQPHQFTNAARWHVPSSSDPVWLKAKEVARDALSGVHTISEAVTNFHRGGPASWKSKQVAMIGNHVFY